MEETPNFIIYYTFKKFSQTRKQSNGNGSCWEKMEISLALESESCLPLSKEWENTLYKKGVEKSNK